MSWLRDHFFGFVFPAFLAAEKRTTELGEPFDVKTSPHAPEKLAPELRKLWTLCKEHGVEWSEDIREVNLWSGTSKYRTTAQLHHGLLRNTLDSACVAMRNEGCNRLLLGGRDVWAFAVLCERRRIPYIFIPELSRAVSDDLASKTLLLDRGFTGQELFLDTGFAGSIPRNLARHFRSEFKFRLMSQSGFRKDLPNQLFPNRQKAREEALETEYLAKYWRTGSVANRDYMGCVYVVFAEWKEKPGPVYRFEGPYQLGSGDTYGLTDGTNRIIVGKRDVEKLCPEFKPWWEGLPEVPELSVEKTIVQFFSDRQSIQRAALLTSNLWRGV